jgi:hypothetical protein
MLADIISKPVDKHIFLNEAEKCAAERAFKWATLKICVCISCMCSSVVIVSLLYLLLWNNSSSEMNVCVAGVPVCWM